MKVTLPNGNVANRLLPVRINDLDISDIKLCESILGGVIRGVDFIYKSAGVNRPLRSKEDNPHDNLNRTIYRDQINKVSLAVKDIIESMKVSISPDQAKHKEIQVKESAKGKKRTINEPIRTELIKSKRKILVRERKPVRPKKIFRSILVIGVASVFLILSLFVFKLYKRQYAHNKLIPEIQKLVEDNFAAPSLAFELATEADKYIHNDSLLIQLWQNISQSVSLQTQPEGARVFWKDYNKPEDSWKESGVTPFKNIRVPLGYNRIKIEKNGFQTVLITSFDLLDLRNTLKLDSIGVLPPNMVRIPSRITPMRIVGLEKYGGRRVGEFLVDRFEVSNKDYKRFVDAEGYSNKSYWNFPISRDGKEISWESAMKIFLDKTGKNGPAGWEVGKYPDGQEDYPVAGISWY